MEKMLIRSKNIVDDKGEKYALYYWILKREVLDNRDNIVNMYGVEVEKYQGSSLLENECAECLSFKKNKVLELIQRLAAGNVTPTTLLVLADDFISIQEQAVS